VIGGGDRFFDSQHHYAAARTSWWEESTRGGREFVIPLGRIRAMKVVEVTGAFERCVDAGTRKNRIGALSEPLRHSKKWKRWDGWDGGVAHDSIIADGDKGAQRLLELKLGT